MRLNVLRSAAITILMICSLPAAAKPVTINNISLDLPSSFTASDYDRGIETKTPDEEVFVWFETYKGSEADTLVAEHDKYWQENKVVPNEPNEKNTPADAGHAAVQTFDYKDATWKGKPTVLRYLRIGPIGAENSMVLVTVWASPEGINQHSKAVEGMLDSMSVKFPK